MVLNPLAADKSEKHIKGVFIIIGAIGNMLRPFLESFLAYFMDFFFKMSINPFKIV